LSRGEIVAKASVVWPQNCPDPFYRKLVQEYFEAGYLAVAWPDGCGAFIPQTESVLDPQVLIEAYEEVRYAAEDAYRARGFYSRGKSRRKRS
jgi:hypothetical protein